MSLLNLFKILILFLFIELSLLNESYDFLDSLFFLSVILLDLFVLVSLIL